MEKCDADVFNVAGSQYANTNGCAIHVNNARALAFACITGKDLGALFAKEVRRASTERYDTFANSAKEKGFVNTEIKKSNASYVEERQSALTACRNTFADHVAVRLSASMGSAKIFASSAEESRYAHMGRNVRSARSVEENLSASMGNCGLFANSAMGAQFANTSRTGTPVFDAIRECFALIRDTTTFGFPLLVFSAGPLSAGSALKARLATGKSTPSSSF